MSNQPVIDYYASFGAREWERIDWPEGQIEYAVTQDAFLRYLHAQARILDLGGGPGRWTIWLAEKGYKVTLADPHFLDELMERGVFTNDVAGRFNNGYGIQPRQVEPFMREYGFEQLELLSDAGFLAAYAQQLAELSVENQAAYLALMKIVIATAGDASNLGSSVHMLYIGRKLMA